MVGPEKNPTFKVGLEYKKVEKRCSRSHPNLQTTLIYFHRVNGRMHGPYQGIGMSETIELHNHWTRHYWLLSIRLAQAYANIDFFLSDHRPSSFDHVRSNEFMLSDCEKKRTFLRNRRMLMKYIHLYRLRSSYRPNMYGLISLRLMEKNKKQQGSVNFGKE